MRLQITAFENCIKCTQYTKSTEDEKFLFWKNSDTSIEKQSNHDWNTPSYLKNNGPHIKVTLIFWFFIMIFYVFIFNCELNVYVHISEIVLNILDKLIHDSQNICGCLTLNAMYIKLTYLIIGLIVHNLTNASSTPPPEGKKQYTA